MAQGTMNFYQRLDEIRLLCAKVLINSCHLLLVGGYVDFDIKAENLMTTATGGIKSIDAGPNKQPAAGAGAAACLDRISRDGESDSPETACGLHVAVPQFRCAR